MILEGAQAGLSWITVLRRIENYREAFDHFDIETVAAYDDEKVESLLQNEGIIRHRLKVKSAIKNARGVLAIQEEFGSFDNYLWSYVDHQPIKNHFSTKEEVPTETEISRKISKDLKKRGFSFVGPTIMYAFMQAVGMVNDHLTSCDLYSS